ncbi:multidrug transporter [Photobacterium kasasachensis]
MVLILTSFIPLLYSTTRIHFLGSMPDSWAFSIAAQVAWLNVGYEVISEALLIPLAFILGQAISQSAAFRLRAATSLSFLVMCYAAVTLVVLLFTPEMVRAMQQQVALLGQTIQYIRLESIAIFVSSGYAFFNLVLVLKNKQKALYGLLITQTILTVACDSLLVSQLPFSLQLGVSGIAITNIIVNLVLVVIAFQFMSNNGIRILLGDIQFRNQSWLMEWFKIGWKSGLESLVRNTAFIVMILQLMNQLQHAGTFWVANQFIWGWLLLPVLALGQLVKQDAATNGGLTSQRVNSYLWLTAGIVLAWLVTAPQWEEFIRSVMGIDDAEQVAKLVFIMIGFYVVFALNNVIDSYFYGIGRTDLMLYQSLIVNSLFYGTTFVLYQIGWFEPTLTRVAVMFGLGITFDALITWGLYIMLRKSAQPSASKLECSQSLS